MRKYSIGGMFAALLFANSSFALTLEEAKQEGRAGETLSGYIAPISKDKETLLLIERINSERAKAYQQVANDNHISADEVAQVAGKKLVSRAAEGEYVRDSRGEWVKK